MEHRAERIRQGHYLYRGFEIQLIENPSGGRGRQTGIARKLWHIRERGQFVDSAPTFKRAKERVNAIAKSRRDRFERSLAALPDSKAGADREA